MRLGEAFFHFEAKITLHDYIPSTIVKTGKFPINNSDFKKRRKWRTREHKQENQEKSHSSVFAKNPIIDSIPSRFQPGYRRVFVSSLGSGFNRFSSPSQGKEWHLQRAAEETDGLTSSPAQGNPGTCEEAEEPDELTSFSSQRNTGENAVYCHPPWRIQVWNEYCPVKFHPFLCFGRHRPRPFHLLFVIHEIRLQK